MQYGGKGQPFPDRSTEALWPSDSLHIVATLPEPPGNLAISQDGRIFCTYHAEGRPEIKVWELIDDKPVPFPSEKWQSEANGEVFLDQIFNIRIDSKNRLWTLDHGFHGLKTPRLLCFNISTGELVERIDIPSTICGKGSYIQDMQIDSACQKIYIADIGVMAHKPGIVIADITTKKCRRVLDKDASVLAGNYEVNAQGRKMYPLFGLFYFHPALDPIALDKKNEWLYYGAMSGEWMYRVKTEDLNNPLLNVAELSKKVEQYAEKSQCDGLTIDNEGNIYVTSIEDGAINVIGKDKKQKTLVKHPKMRWPDGLSFGPDGYIYVADSDIPDVMMQSKSHMKSTAPYYLFKFKALANAKAGQ